MSAMQGRGLVSLWMSHDCREDEEHSSDEQPDFLPMFPWYSGTSADLYRTIFGLVVSLKLFLGRFDMRTMQVPASHAFCRHASNVHNKLNRLLST